MVRIVVLMTLLLSMAPIDRMIAAERKDANQISIAPGDWPWWRGPNRDGIAQSDQQPPLTWSDKQNVIWKSPVPGRGHGSATVVGGQVFLATADLQTKEQLVLCYDRSSGKQLWKSVVHQGGLVTKGNKKATLASSTVACDGKRLFINFINDGAMITTALSRDGKKLWQTKITDYVVHQGFGSSPALYKSLVLVSADNKGGGAVAALDRASGKIIWKNLRPKTPNYASPIILNAAGRTQVVFTGCNIVASFDPLSGKSLWEMEGSTTECVTSTVTDGKHIFTSGGYPKNHISAVRADGSGEIVWQNAVRVYVPSMLVHQGYLYAVTDSGVAMCWKSDTGESVWKGRLGGTFSSSPVLVGEHMYVTNESGRTFVFKANPKKFELVAQSDLGEQVFATPTFCDSRIYMRVAEQIDGQRQEMLYCLGKK